MEFRCGSQLETEFRRVESLEFQGFEWDEAKRLKVLFEREIDFVDVASALLKPHLERRSDHEGEVRFLSLCELGGEVVATVYTERGDNCRIITARAADQNERRKYREIFRR